MSLELLCLSLFLTFSTSSKAAINSATCGIPGQPFGGAVLSTSQNYSQNGDIVTYSCEYIDYLLGSSNRTCRSDGKWTGSVPLCLSPTMIVINTERALTLDRNLTTCTAFNSPVVLRNDLARGSALYAVRVILNSTLYHDYIVAIDFKLSVSTEHYPNESTECVEIESGNFGPDSKFQVTFDCSSTSETAYVVYIFIERKGVVFNICDFYFFFRPDDSKCGTPDAPLHGKITETSKDRYFEFHCDPGFDLYGSTNTSCLPDRSWTKKAPHCIKVAEKNPSLNGKEDKQWNLLKWNWNYLYMGLGGLAILIILIVAIVLIVRSVKRYKAIEDPFYAWSGQDNTVTPSHIRVPLPLPSDAHPIQGTRLRQLHGDRNSESPNYYSVAIIPCEENQYQTIVENEDTGTPLYEECFSGCSRDLYDDCCDRPQQVPPLPQPPQTRFSQLAILKPNLVLKHSTFKNS